MDYDSNIFYHPEKHGLSVVAELDYASGYEFNTRVVWKQDSTGILFTAQDSGCSCPTPFEDFDGIESLDRVGPDFRDIIRAEFDDAYEKPTLAEYEDFLNAVDNAMGVIEQPGVLRT